MKKFFYAVLAVFAIVPVCGLAQIHIEDDFLEHMTLDWTEFAEKNRSALVQNGYIELISKDKERPTAIWTDELPVISDIDFTVTAEIQVPKLTEDYSFGIIFNRSEHTMKKELFLISSRNIKFVGSSELAEEEWPIKLPAGKDKTVTVEVKRVGGKTIISVNDMQAAKFKCAIGSPAFGFWTPGDSSLRVTKVSVDQDTSESEMQ